MINRTVENDSLILEENGKELLKIHEKIESGEAALVLEGNISTSVSHDFEDELTSVATICNRINLDFHKIDGISSAGMDVLLSIQKLMDQREGTQLKLKGLQKGVYKSFEEYGFLELFEIEE